MHRADPSHRPSVVDRVRPSLTIDLTTEELIELSERGRLRLPTRGGRSVELSMRDVEYTTARFA